MLAVVITLMVIAALAILISNLKNSPGLRLFSGWLCMVVVLVCCAVPEPYGIGALCFFLAGTIQLAASHHRG